jgi:ferrous iron transport protein B
MMDMAESKGYHIDTKALAQEIGAPIVPMVASRNQGTNELVNEIIRIAKNKIKANSFSLNYGIEAEAEIAKLEEFILKNPLSQKYPPRWLAVKLLEEDEEIIRKFQEAEVV